MFMYYLLIIPYTSTGISLLILKTLFSRLRPNKSNSSKIEQYSLAFIVIFYIINTFLLRFLFSMNTIFSLIQNVIVIGVSYFVIEQVSIVGITGQICSGKSTMVEYLRDKYKASVIEIDQLNREILKRKEVIRAIEKKFGDEVFTIDENTNQKVLNKQKIKEIIFKDPQKKKQLERITHFRVFLSFFLILFREKLFKGKKYVFVENAILLRFSIFKMLCKSIISVCVNENKILIDRIVQRDNCSRETAVNILNSQMKVEEFMQQSNHVIFNEKNESDFFNQIDETLKLIY